MKEKLFVVLSVLALAVGCSSRTPSPGGPTNLAEAKQPFQANVLQAARKNDAYRHVLFTGARSQLALMTIQPGGDIGLETHAHVEQLIFIASGEGKGIVNGVETPLTAGDVLVATPGTTHDVVNTGTEPLRIYTVYTPPNHPDGTVHPTKADAEADKVDEAFGARVE